MPEDLDILLGKYVLQNAVKYGGKPQAGTVISRVMGEYPELRSEGRKVSDLTGTLVKENLKALPRETAGGAGANRTPAPRRALGDKRTRKSRPPGPRGSRERRGDAVCPQPERSPPPRPRPGGAPERRIRAPLRREVHSPDRGYRPEAGGPRCLYDRQGGLRLARPRHRRYRIPERPARYLLRICPEAHPDWRCLHLHLRGRPVPGAETCEKACPSRELSPEKNMESLRGDA